MIHGHPAHNEDDHHGREREEREDIFSQVFTMIHIKSFVQNIQTKTEMEPHDQF